MNRAKMLFGLGLLWAGTMTLPCFLFYVLPFVTLGWYRYHGWNGLAWVFTLNDKKAPVWLQRLWLRWGGQTMGNIIVYKQYDEATESRYLRSLYDHEATHVRQGMALGPFLALMVGMNFLCLKVLEKTIGNINPYYDSPTELHARRCAGQIVDVVGYAKKISQKSKTT